MYIPDKDTQKLKDLIDDELKVKGYIRYPFVESFLKELKREAYFMGMNKLFEGIDDEFHSFIIDEEVGKVLIRLKEEAKHAEE